jgi:hypothetical protein
MRYVDYVYEIVKNEGRNFDALYQDYILELVGIMGMQALLENNLLETCGVVNGRQLFVLCEKDSKN